MYHLQHQTRLTETLEEFPASCPRSPGTVFWPIDNSNSCTDSVSHPDSDCADCSDYCGRLVNCWQSSLRCREVNKHWHIVLIYVRQCVLSAISLRYITLRELKLYFIKIQSYINFKVNNYK